MHTQQPGPAVAAALETAAARLASPGLMVLERMHPAWLARFEASGPETAPVPLLLELLQTAPTQFALGMAFAALPLRVRQRATAKAELEAIRSTMRRCPRSGARVRR